MEATKTIPDNHPLKLNGEELQLAQAALARIEIDSEERGGIDEEAVTNIVMASGLSELGKVRLMFRAAGLLTEKAIMGL